MVRSGEFCKYKACGKITKHPSGYCHVHNKQWLAGYKYALKQLQGCQSPETCSRGEMLASIDTQVSGDIGGERCGRTLELTFTWEGEESEGFRQSNSVGMHVVPSLAGSGNGHQREKTKNLGCGLCPTD